MSTGLNTVAAPVLDPVKATDMLLDARYSFAVLRDSTLGGDPLNKKMVAGIALVDVALEDVQATQARSKT